MALLTRTLQFIKVKDAMQSVSRFLNTCNVFAPRITPILSQTNINYNNPWIYKQPDSIKSPIINNIQPIRLPNDLTWMPLIKKDPDLITNINIEAPATINSNNDIQAARLIVIRRKKMKKHKLRKLRKRMKFAWAKVRQRRELIKEKVFQAGLIKQCKEADQFSAEKYVEDKLGKLHEIIIPRYWKGKPLPEFLIREKMGLPPKK